MTVISGWLGLFGISLSTVSVHERGEYPPLPATFFAPKSVACRHKDEDGDPEPVPPGAASYTRYSSEHQDARSIPDQQRKCRSQASSHGNDIRRELEFYDHAESGTKHDRAGLEALMAACRAGLIHALYFENLSRLARDCVLTMQMLRELVYVLKIRIVSVDEGIDSATNDNWELLAAIFGIQHEQYVKALSKFVFRGQEGVVIDGLCVGDYCFGYGSEPIPDSERKRTGRNDKPKMRYVIEAQEAAWVQMIFHWFAVEKRSLRWIAAELNKLGVPKDHRASTPHWYHQLIPSLLGNTKYIGYWPWGKRKNVRDPMTGKTHQEDRPAHETDKWLRHIPELRIVDDELFAKVQERLKESTDAVALRNAKSKSGRRKREFAGSTKQAAETWPRHLLSNLIECAECGRRFYVGGGHGRYMFCRSYRMGVCSCGTSLNRERAEKMILDAIAAEILKDKELCDVLVSSTLTSWEHRELQLPSERASTAKALAEVENAMTRLIDRCEREDVPELSERLQQRRQERLALQAKLKRLDDAVGLQKARPDKQWILAQLDNLAGVLSGECPAAALTLRKLVGGRIVVSEVKSDGKKRGHLRGEFRVHLRNLVDAIGAPLGATDDETAEALSKAIVIDFREPDDVEKLADAVKADFDANMTFEEIGAKYHHSKQWASRAFAHWHKVRGLPVPDARSLRARLDRRRPLDAVLQAQAMELWNQDALIDEIARKLGRRRDEIHAVVAAWHVERGLTMPDGRTRRREIRLRRQERRQDLDAG